MAIADTNLKLGYWRINPATGVREWIEQSNQPKKPKLELEEEPAEEVIPPEEPPEEPVEKVELPPPVAPIVEIEELATAYNLPAGKFIGEEALALLTIPPEERGAGWDIPYEQYLTWQQAQSLGFDVPEGSVVKMTPMVDAEPQFSLMPSPEVWAERRVLLAEFEDTLRLIYPEMFDPRTSWARGAFQYEVPTLEMVVTELQNQMATDYSGFVADLYGRVDQGEAETILRLLGVTEEHILLTLDFKEQEVRVNTLITDVFPDFDNVEKFSQLLEEDWGLFVETIQTGGQTSEKRALLQFMGYNPDEINSFFNTIRIIDAVDGVRQELVIDVPNKKAYDREGNWVGTYNVVTREFTQLPDEIWIKDVWDAFVLGGAHIYQQSKQFVVSALPNFLFRDSYQWERDLYGDEWADAVDAGNKKIRDEFRRVYALNQTEFERWVAKRPELAPPAWAREDIVTRLKEDPLKTILYEFASTAPFMIAVMGTTVGVSIATGNPLLGIAAGAAMATPPQAQDAHDALLAAGATEAQAGQMSLPIGLLMSAIEAAGDLPYLKQVFPSVFRMFTKEIIEEVAKRTMASMIKKGITTFTMIEITEALEEVFQDAVLNAGIRTFDENQGIFEGWEETFLRTIVATSPLAVFGAGTSLRRVSPSETRGQTDAELRAKGFIQDPKTGNWYQRLREALKNERGFAVPGEFLGMGEEEVRPTRITKETWDATPVEQRVTQAETAGLEGKVGSKAFADLTTAEIDTLSAIRPAIPTAEPGMPEAGLQPPLIPGVPAEEVRPAGKGEVVQISMEDQLKLEQVRRDAEEASPEAREAYAEAEGLKANLSVDPVAQYRIEETVKRKVKQPDGTYKLTETTRRYGLDRFISIKEGTFPSYFTLKQAQAIKPSINVTPYSQPGTPLYNHIPIADVLDELADKWGMTPDEIADRVMAIREEKRRIKTLEATIKTQMVEKPLTPRTELTSAEVTENWNTIGQPKLTLKQVDALTAVFAEYVLDPNTLKAIELTRALRSEEMSKRFQNMKARAQELIVGEGVTSEQAIKQAISETMAGQLPGIRTDYLEGIVGEMRDAHFAKVYHTFSKLGPQYQGEMMATVTALTNALSGRPIPRKRGTGSILFPEGGSAWDRLNYVFGKRPKILKAIDKMAKEKKPLDEVMEGVFHEIGREPIPIDQKTADYLRKLSDIPQGYKTLLEPEFNYPTVLDIRTGADMEFAKADLELGRRFAEGELTFDEFQLERTRARDKAYPVSTPPPFEPPIQKAFEQLPMFTFMEKRTIVRVLKELAYSPLDIGNFIRANIASFDQSFLRQAKLLASGHPIIFAQSYRKAWQATFSQKDTEASWERITRDPDFQIYEEERLRTGHDPLRVPAFAGVKGTAQWRTAEEFGFPTQERWIPTLTGKIPHIKLSERGFSTGLNELVWSIWKAKLQWSRRYSEKIASGEVKLPEGQAFDILQEMSEQQAMLANMIQRATLKRFSGLAPAFNAFFFALRSKLGRFLFPIHLTGLSYSRARGVTFNPRVMKEAWKDFLLMNAIFGGIMLLGDWLDLWETEKDPRNAEFMSARIGNIRIDPWAGYRQFVVLYARLATGTGVSSVTGAEYEVDKLGALEGFMRTSVSPMMGILLDFWTGRNFLGQVVEITDAKQWLERLLPFSVQDVWKAYEYDSTMGLIVIPLAIHGEGIQTYTGDWVENWTKLGLPKYMENTGYGIMEPYYDTADFWADTSSQFIDVDPATLTAKKGYPEYIRAIAEARIINEHLSTLTNVKLVSIEADPEKGNTFADYYQMWRDREKLVLAGDEAELKVRELQPDGKYKVITYKGEEAVEAFDRDERTRNAHLGSFSQRQFALLYQYWAITDPKEQAEFLKKHKAEIGINPRQDWLRKHPNENAQLAVWGQAKILTKEAYTEFNRLIKELDIPDNAIPLLTLPPETSIDTHFAYEDMVSEGTHSSIEAQLLLLKDHLAAEEAGVQSYVDWRTDSGNPLTLSDKSVEYLQLRADNQDLFDELEEAMAIPIKADRDAAVGAVRDTKVGDETFRDIERRVDVMGKGTREVPIPDEIVNAYVSHMRIVDETSGNSAEAKLNRYDNPDLNDFLMNEDVWGKQKAEALDENKEYLDNYLIPRWRIDVKYRTEDFGYDNLPSDDVEARAAYLAGEGLQGADLQRRIEYRYDRRRREAYQMSTPRRPITLDTVRQFLKTDKVNELQYKLRITVEEVEGEKKVVPPFVCEDFTRKLIASADKEGFDLREATITFETPIRHQISKTGWELWERHSIAYFDVDGERFFIEPQTDEVMTETQLRNFWKEYGISEISYGERVVPIEQRFPIDQIDNFIAYWEIPVKGKRQERFLADNPEFADAMHNIAGIDIPKPQDVPAIQYDDIYDQFADDFERLEGLADNESEFYIEDTEARDIARNALRFDERGRYNEFGLAEIRRNGYGAFVPEQFIDAYVGYYKLIGEGKPANWKLNTGTDLWYDDDWFMMENMGFYREVYIGLFGKERLDFTKVPTREVFNQYLTYLALPHLKSKDDFRWNNRELDAWLVLKFDYTPIAEKKRRKGLTPYERFLEEWEERGKAIEESLAALRE